jgi:hypothetical protein
MLDEGGLRNYPHQVATRKRARGSQAVDGWQKVLRADPTAWLLEDDNPSVRYLTLQDLLDRHQADAEVVQARGDIMHQGMVPRILARQDRSGGWEKPDSFYTAKYRGTTWQLIILAELMANGMDPRIQRACQLILDYSQDHESHGFSLHRAAKTGGGRHSEVVPCLTGNLVWSLIRLGWLDHPAVQRAIQWITSYQRFDDGVEPPPRGWPYDKWEMCWGLHTCHMGVVKALKALAEIPPERRSKDVRRTLDAGVDYVLRHHVYKRSHALHRISRPGWLRFGFPLMYQTDVLEILLILTQLGCRDRRMREAVDVVISQQGPTARWNLGTSFNGRYLVNVERKGRPSKWLTLRALTVLKRFGAGSPS